MQPRVTCLAATTLAATALSAASASAATRSLSVAEYGFSTYSQDVAEHASWGAILRNSSSRYRLNSVVVTARFYNGSGRLVGTDTERLAGIAAGRTAAVGNAGAEFCTSDCSAIARVNVKATYRNRTRSSSTQSFRIDRCRLESNSFGDWQVQVRVRAPWASANIPLTAILRDGNGKIAGGYTGRADYFTPGTKGDQIGPFDGEIAAVPSRTRCYSSWGPRQ